jgi:hypothetical protein
VLLSVTGISASLLSTYKKGMGGGGNPGTKLMPEILRKINFIELT